MSTMKSLDAAASGLFLCPDTIYIEVTVDAF
jgi:hypothetical protein